MQKQDRPSATTPTSDLDPFSDEFLSRPHEAHEQLRELGPVVWLEKYELYAMARFDEVSAALADWETYISSAGVGLEDLREGDQWRPPSVLLETDPPDHENARRLVTRVLTPIYVRGLREHFSEVAGTVVSDAVEKETFDAIPDIATAFPMAVFPDALGLKDEGREALLPYASMIFNAFGPQNERYQASFARGGDSQRWVRDQARPGATAADGIGGRIHQLAVDTDTPPALASGVVAALLAAGLDTTMHALGTAIRLLAENPPQFQHLRDDPSLARAAFEEAIRVDSPVQTFARTTTREVVVGDVTIPRDSKVLLFLGSANRDPRRWDRPEEYDITRNAGGHVGFGFGIHACVGQMLARLEGEAVLTALSGAAETIAIAGPVEYDLNNTLRGLHALPVIARKAGR